MGQVFSSFDDPMADRVPHNLLDCYVDGVLNRKHLLDFRQCKDEENDELCHVLFSGEQTMQQTMNPTMSIQWSQ